MSNGRAVALRVKREVVQEGLVPPPLLRRLIFKPRIGADDIAAATVSAPAAFSKLDVMVRSHFDRAIINIEQTRSLASFQVVTQKDIVSKNKRRSPARTVAVIAAGSAAQKKEGFEVVDERVIRK